MVKVFVPDESEIPLKWASEKATIASFLMSYCRNKFPDNQEYIERYTACYDKWSAEYKKIVDEAIEYLNENEIDEYMCEDGKVTYREVISNRFASTEFKKVHADLYEAFTKKTSSMRFTCN